MARIKGVSVFRSEGDGTLSSKYVNNSSVPFTESCKRVEGEVPGDLFLGTYETVWLEQLAGNPISNRSGRLIISIDGKFNNYHLKWEALNGESYEGIGMLYGSLLAVSYWSLPR